MLTVTQAKAILQSGYQDDFRSINNQTIIRIDNVIFYIADSEIHETSQYDTAEEAKEQFNRVEL